MKLTEKQYILLQQIASKWPDPFTVAPETDDLMALREADFIYQWDMHENGDRRWMVTTSGKSALKTDKLQ